MKKGQKRNWTLPLKILYSIVVSCVFAVPAMIGYALKLQVTRQNFFSLGVYGLIVFTFIFLQLTFATLNRYLVYRYKDKVPPIQPLPLKEASTSSDQVVIELASTNTRLGTKLGLAVVGYREEPSLFTQCLESVKILEYPDPFKIVVVIDGDEDADREMAALFQKTFPDAPIVVLPELLSTSFHKYKADFKQKRASSTEKVDEQENVELDPLEAGFDGVLQESLILPTDTRAVCYIQPHCGKRHAMYTAFRVLMASGCEAVMSTDSDTKFDPKAMMEMEQALYWFPRIGAAAGDVRIWNNRGSLLSFMSSLRYWMAFNIERAAQSFNRCVTCVSGPMGIYRSHVLREILDDWINQTFLGLECTYGDDRHLTNRALLHGYRVVYTHLAFCETETPTAFLRWFKQQTRWSKSFYRELLWNAKSIHKHSPWMAAELFYQGIYPFVLLFSVFNILWAKTPFILTVWAISLGAIAIIKTVYSLMVTFNIGFLAFPLYSIYYLLGLVPAKIWAIVSLWDVGWGTSARSAAELKRENVFCTKLKEAMPVILWLLLLAAGIAFNVARFLMDPEKPTMLEFFGLAPTSDPTSIVFFSNPNNNLFIAT